jgi:hypothetical protein
MFSVYGRLGVLISNITLFRMLTGVVLEITVTEIRSVPEVAADEKDRLRLGSAMANLAKGLGMSDAERALIDSARDKRPDESRCPPLFRGGA